MNCIVVLTQDVLCVASVYVILAKLTKIRVCVGQWYVVNPV